MVLSQIKELKISAVDIGARRRNDVTFTHILNGQPHLHAQDDLKPPTIIRHLHDDRPSDHNTRLGQRIRGISRPSIEST